MIKRLLLIIACTVLPTQASAAQVCKNRKDLIESLAEKFQETQQSFGLQSDMRVLEVYSSHTGSWTAILTRPNGKSCVVASGQAWTTVKDQLRGKPL
jgi:predicted methyltransferase